MNKLEGALCLGFDLWVREDVQKKIVTHAFSLVYSKHKTTLNPLYPRMLCVRLIQISPVLLEMRM